MTIWSAPCTQQLTPIFPSGYASALTLLNTDNTNSIYLCDGPSGNLAAAWPLSPQQSQSWEAGRPLYILAAAGSPILTYTDQAIVSSDPEAVAIALIDAGLAGDIAQQISLQGAPPLNAFDLLASYSGIPSGFQLAYEGILKYQSIRVITNEFETGGSGLARGFNVNWTRDVPPYSPPAFNTGRDIFYQMGAGLNVYTDIPVRGPGVSITALANAHTTNNLNGYLLGMYRTVSQMVVNQNAGYWSPLPASKAGSLEQGWVSDYGISKTAGSQYADVPPTRSGPAIWTIRAAVATAQLEAWLLDYNTGEIIDEMILPIPSAPGVQTASKQTMLPHAPVQWVFSSAPAITSGSISLTMQPV